jgi:hypothetical protein
MRAGILLRGMRDASMVMEDGMIFVCTTCGEPAMAIKPGSSPRVCAGIIIERGHPDEAFCRAHWLRRFGARQPDLFGVVP